MPTNGNERGSADAICPSTSRSDGRGYHVALAASRRWGSLSTMTDAQVLAKLFHTTLSALVRDGRAPHYTQLAKEIGVSVEDGRDALRDLVATGVPAIWLHAGDYIASFAPFSNIPTHIEVSVDGVQKWYGQ